MEKRMLPTQNVAEVATGIVKSCIDWNSWLDEISKETQKEWIDMGKGLFANDKVKALFHAVKCLDLLRRW